MLLTWTTILQFLGLGLGVLVWGKILLSIFTGILTLIFVYKIIEIFKEV